ncbi:hypothetical protein PHLCEN_2v829 [Hermanssonia centrifuga]|uniref:Uncharacterized protein n=1 Tax=Hermanssonia centrifuga TaxID=98765 RepID=A0A2R6S515_9APHY|nr:hypothetical protein PHLCEN_2v829 [Hermanssonia centrifuga]
MSHTERVTYTLPVTIIYIQRAPYKQATMSIHRRVIASGHTPFHRFERSIISKVGDYIYVDCIGDESEMETV